MLSILLIMAIAVVLSLAFTPLSIILAKKWGVVDQPNPRKVHQNPMPRLGGMAIFFSALLTFIIAYHLGIVRSHPHIWVALIGSIIIFSLGLWDDLHNLRPRTKFIVQFLVAGFVASQGLLFDKVTIPFGSGSFELGILSYPLTILWIVGITNAVNLLDGLDGLATGTSAITFLALAAIAATSGNQSVLVLSLVFLSSVIGFLPYNFNPAKTFMGDCGSLFLGFSLSLLALAGSALSPTALGIIIPITVLGLPIFDTLFSMFRRIALGKKPFNPDKEHIHHKLLALGFTHRQAVLILYALALAFGAGAFLITATHSRLLAGFAILYALGLFHLVRWLGSMRGIYRHREKKDRQRLYSLYSRTNYKEHTFATRLFRRISLSHGIWLLGDILSFVFWWWSIRHWIRPIVPQTLSGMSPLVAELIIGVSMMTLTLLFLYQPIGRRPLWRFIEFNNVVRYWRAILLGCGIPFFFAPELLMKTELDVGFLLFFLLAFGVSVTGLRLTMNFYYNLLKRRNYRYRSGERVLIMGAGDSGEQLFKSIMKYQWLNYMVAGFVDDDPLKVGRTLYDIPILGKSDQLNEIKEKTGATRLLVSCHLRSKKRETVVERCKKAGLQLSQLQVVMVDLEGLEPSHPLPKTDL